MFSSALIVLAIASGVLAVPTPTTPGPSDAFTALGECAIAWNADTNTTKPWTTMNIQLMTGSNAQMTHMRTVATVDATKQTNFSWTCPEVNPYAPIYFYQFSSPVDPANLLWVTRFVIKSSTGSFVPASLTDSSGVAWGNGYFVDPSLYNAMPAYLVGNGQLQGSPVNGTTTGSGAPAPTGLLASLTATSTGTGNSTGTITTVTKTGTATSSARTSTSTASTGGAPLSASSSWLTLLGAIVVGTIVL